MTPQTPATEGWTAGGDDTAICPACNGAGVGSADTDCGFCGGSGGVPIAAAEHFEASRARWGYRS